MAKGFFANRLMAATSAAVRYGTVHRLSISFLIAAGLIGACGDGKGGAPAASGGSAAGGAGGADVISEELELVAQMPVADASNVDAHAPFVFQFNTELDAASVEAALRVRLGGRDVAFDAQVNGKELRIVLTAEMDLPAAISVSLGPQLRGSKGQLFSGASFSYSLPLWFSEDSLQGEATLQVDVTSLSYLRASSYALAVAAVDGRMQVVKRGNIGDELLPPPTDASDVVVLGAAVSGDVISLAWSQSSGTGRGVYVATFDGAIWQGSDEPLLQGQGLVAVAAQVDDKLVVAGGAVNESGWGMGGGSGLTAGTVRAFVQNSDGTMVAWPTDFDLPSNASSTWAITAHAAGEPVIAVRTHEQSILVFAAQGNAWSELGSVQLHQAAALGSLGASLSVATQGTSVWLGYSDGDDVSQHAYLARHAQQGFEILPALDVELDAQVAAVRLVGDSESAFVAWQETYAGEGRAFVAEISETGGAAGRVRILGREAVEGLQASTTALSLNLDPWGLPAVGIASTQGVRLARYNGSASLPAAFTSGQRGGCAMPADTEASFPQTLKDTGCYEDLASQKLVSAALPYNLNSPLWSDGALKHRYVLLPDNGHVGFDATGALDLPVGTLVIKEFYLEKTVGDPSTIFPVETRFLVRRCSGDATSCPVPWQGYSYQWNDAGTDATLLKNVGAIEKAWTVYKGGSPVAHQHIYPGRSQCLECHAASVGSLLGVDAPQLNRPQDYGQYVANQLETWESLGVFGDTVTAAGVANAARMPSPADVGQPVEARALAYMDSNCSHCHQPGGKCSQANVDLRYFGPGVEASPTGNICDKTDAALPLESLIYKVQATRTTTAEVTPMPQIASNLVDERNLPLMEAWLKQLIADSSCAP